MLLILTLVLLSPKEKEIFRQRFTYALLEIYFKKEKVLDCADFIRKGFIKATSKNTIFQIKNKKIIIPFIENIKRKTPFLVKEKDKFLYSSFADVKNLILYNTFFLGKDKNKINLESGDLLFFYNPKQKLPYHSMVYLKIEGKEYLIYHTGPSEESPGELKLISYHSIFKVKNPAFLPIEKNDNFLGFFRWKILK